MAEKVMSTDVISTDGDWFESMHDFERRFFEEIGDTEALRILDEEEAAAQREYEEELAAEEADE